MIQSPHRILAALTLGLLASACGSSSGSSTPAASADLAIQSISVIDGSTWHVNRPIEIVFDRPINFGTVHGGSIQIVDSMGVPAGGVFSQPLDATGSLQTNRLIFRPTCPSLPDGSDAGFTPGGTRYELTLFGTDLPGLAILPLQGNPLPITTTIGFFTPNSTAPTVLFFDPVAGPPRLKVRGTGGISNGDPYATHLEVAATATGTAYFHYNSLAGQGVLTASDMARLGDGLPRNHYSVPSNQTGFVFALNQAINPEPANLKKLRVEYLNVTWKALPGRAELISNCSPSGDGALVRFKPQGLLPPGTALRMVVGSGFQDLTGDSTLVNSGSVATINTTFSTTGSSVPVDLITEAFWLSGDEPGSLEDTEVTFAEPKASWGPRSLAPVWGTNGQSRARSKWIPLGLGHINPGGPTLNPRFVFGGTNLDGTIPIVGGAVDPGAVTSAPMPLLGLESQAVTIALADIVSLDEVYMAQPSLLQGCRIELSPPAGSSTPIHLNVGATTINGTNLRISLLDACAYDIGDCVPLDLNLSYAGPAGVTATIRPRSFSMATRVISDQIPADARITILFDATSADADGNPDPAAAASNTLGWRTDIQDLSNGPWQFVRFEVFFEMDVSGDGWGAFDPLPYMRWLTIGFDQRP